MALTRHANSIAELKPARDECASALPRALQGRRAALVIAHPGHELRVYYWLKLARPTVFILTDGSGQSGNSRLHRTTSALEQIGAGMATIYGQMTDAEMYAAIIRRDVPYFIELTIELAQCLREQEIEYVVGDALEGYNPAHDLCRYVTNAAVMSLSSEGRRLENYAVLMANQNGNGTDSAKGTIAIQLDAGSLAEKMQIAQSYTEMLTDVQRVLADEGIESIGTERLRYLSDLTFGSFSETPYYEVYGRQQVALGRYNELLTFHAHVRPIAEALETWARKDVRPS